MARPPGDSTVSDSYSPSEPAGEPVVAELPPRDRARYEVLEEHARGGLGRILRARDRDLDRIIALKELLGATPRGEARFEREIRLTARLEHPSIVPLHDAGRFADTGQPFYAMKLVAGASLKDVVGRTATLDERLALLPNVLAVAEAMAYAHSRGIVHRDLKPSNVIVGEFGETIVIDWGLAKNVDANEVAAGADVPSLSDESVTVAGSVLGTPSFMAPEQARGERVDARADVYAIGALAYYAFAGRYPVDGSSSDEILRRVRREAPPPLRAREPSVPSDLAAIVDKAMAREPADRYPSAKELAGDLRRYQTGRLVLAREYAWWEILWRQLAKHWLVASVTLAFLVLGAVGLTVAMRREQGLRRTAEDERGRAEAAQARAEEQTLGLLEQQARRELDAGRPRHAAVYLADALRREPGSRVFRWLMSQAARAQRAHVRTLLGHQRDVVSAEFSPDDRWLATGSSDHTVRIWDVATGAVVRTLDAGERGCEDLAWSPDGSLLANGNTQRVRIWRVADGTLVHDLEGSIYRLSFSPDGRKLWAGSNVGDVSVWDVATGQRTVLPRKHEDRVLLLLDRGGKRLVTASLDGKLIVWDPVTMTAVREMERAEPIELLAESPDGKILVTGDSVGVLQLRDAETLAVLHRSYLPRTSVAKNAWFVDEGRALITASVDGTVRTWHATSGQILATIDAVPEGKLFGAALSHDGRLLATTALRQVDLWRPTADVDYRIFEGATHAFAEYHPAILSADGRWLAVTWLHGEGEAALRVYDAQRGVVVATWPEAGLPYSLAINRDGSRVYVGDLTGGQEVRVRDGRTGALLATLPGHGQRLYNVALDARDEAVATAGGDKTVRIYDAVTAAPGPVIELHERATAVAFDPVHPRLAAAGESGTIYFIDRTTGAITDRLAAHATWIEDLEFSADGQRLVSAGRMDHTGKVWDLAHLEAPPVLLSGHSDNMMRASFSPDGTLVATVAVDETARLWDAATGTLLRTIPGGTYTAAFSPDGQTLYVTGNRDYAVAWSLALDPRSPAELARDVDRESPWRLEGGKLVTKR